MRPVQGGVGLSPTRRPARQLLGAHRHPEGDADGRRSGRAPGPARQLLLPASPDPGVRSWAAAQGARTRGETRRNWTASLETQRVLPDETPANTTQLLAPSYMGIWGKQCAIFWYKYVPGNVWDIFILKLACRLSEAQTHLGMLCLIWRLWVQTTIPHPHPHRAPPPTPGPQQGRGPMKPWSPQMGLGPSLLVQQLPTRNGDPTGIGPRGCQGVLVGRHGGGETHMKTPVVSDASG